MTRNMVMCIRQAYFSSASEIFDQTFKQELGRIAKDAYNETLLYIATLQSIFDFPEESYRSLKIMTC